MYQNGTIFSRVCVLTTLWRSQIVFLSAQLNSTVRLMKIVDECLRHAQECRELAARIGSPMHREQLLEMAAIWERMADERTQGISRDPQVALDKDGD
jgi:hypothetical protein